MVARSAAAPEQPQREVTDGWFAAIADAGLPVAWTEGARSRPRIAFGAPLPIGMAADAELIDVVLTERWPAWRLRETLAEHVPAGWRLVDVQDVWLAGPALAGRVAAADYRVVLDRFRAGRAALRRPPRNCSLPRLCHAAVRGATRAWSTTCVRC